MFAPGWMKKALHLRTIVSCIPEIVELPAVEVERFDGMRAFNRGTINEAELKRRIDALPPHELIPLMFEPLEAYGWEIRATLCAISGKAWWLTGVKRTTSKPPTDNDKKILFKMLDVLGCDPARDRLSVGELDFLLSEGVPFMYSWPNTIELQEIHVHADKRGKDMMRIVPRGSRGSDGYEPLANDDKPPREPAG